ncbi:hypothetical protein SETIT_9G180700v2 [Setaria italica]|uniref:BTB domain-containing protein n=1 Tax=Setaria italica TaxID=4555 RepID=A0A368SHV6_SETIT|nr:hypothetical protein SETIT_9G180700v2 [Setaria italica]
MPRSLPNEAGGGGDSISAKPIGLVRGRRVREGERDHQACYDLHGWRSASAIVADTASGYHVLKIDGYSRTTGTPTGEFLKSLPFTVGGHRWCIRYYPNGNDPETKDYISLYLHLHRSVTEEVKAHFEFRFVGDVTEQALALEGVHTYDSHYGWGHSKFIKGKNWRETPEVTAPASVSVPPSDLHKHVGALLLTEKGADVLFDVAGQTFAAHRCVLAARSPVFSAELLGVMKESDTGAVVHIDDMEAWVFKALLYFVYTDLFPTSTKEEVEGEQDDDVLSQHLLVAADRYNLERLKLLREQKLCEYIDVGTVTTIWPGPSRATRLPWTEEAAVASDGFEHLSRSCPSVMKQIIAMLAN